MMCSMSLINSYKNFASKQTNPKKVIMLCGFGGAIWQTQRLISILNRTGYDVTAVDFSKEVLSKGDPSLLPKLVAEVVEFAEDEARRTNQKMLLIGISLGSLLSLNILRRSNLFDSAVMLTGGNIVTVAQNIYGPDVWPQSHAKLADAWKDVNIFTEPELLKDKRMLFVLPTKDRLIDTSEVIDEIARQNDAGNYLQLIRRGSFGHVGTIVEETILFPRRVLRYIEQVETLE